MALLTNINGKFSVSDAGAVTFNDAFTFPTADGTANYVLKTNGSGQLAWAQDTDYDYWVLQGDSSANTNINSTNTLKFVGGTYIDTGATWAGGSNPRKLTIDHETTSRTDTTSTDEPAFGGTFEAVTSITTNTTGHITAIDVSTVTIPSDSGFVTGSGTLNKVPRWTATGSDLGDGPITFSGNNSTFAGGINVGTYIRTDNANTDYNIIQRNSTGAALYVQQRGTGNILDLQYGTSSAGGATSAFFITSSGTGTFSGDVNINKKLSVGGLNGTNSQLTVETPTVAAGGTLGAAVFGFTGTSQVTSGGAVTPTNQIQFKPAMPAGYGTDGYNSVLEQQSGGTRIFYFRTSGANHLSIDVEHNGTFGGGIFANTGSFTGLVSGITPTSAANFATKAYVDGVGGSYLPLSGGTMSGTINMNNNQFINVGGITINDPGVSEGIQWNGGNGWAIYESPNNLTNASGNLQFVESTTRTFTVEHTTGNIDIPRDGVNKGAILQQNSHFVNKRFEFEAYVNNTTTAYMILCENAANQDVNGIITMDRTSGLRHACSIQVLLSSGSTATPVGGLKSIGTAGNGRPVYELVTCDYDDGTGSSSHIAVKMYNPDGYYETSGAYFTGRIVNSNNGVIVPVLPAAVSNVAVFQSNTAHNFQGNLTVNQGNIGVKNTNPIFSVNTNLSMEGASLAYLNGTSANQTVTNNIGVTHSSSTTGSGSEGGLYLANNNNSNGAPSPIIFFSAKSASTTYNHAYAAIYGIKTGGGADSNWNVGSLTFATGDGTGPKRRMTIDTNGKVGIGTTATPGRMLEVNGGTTLDGGIRLSCSANLSNFWSGIEFKSTVATSFIYMASDDADGTLKFLPDAVLKATLSKAGTWTVAGDIVAYGSPSDVRLKENIKPIESALDKVSKLQGVTFDWIQKEDKILDIKEDIGFIAQDVQKIIPELVRENDDGMLSMRHQGIAPVLLEAIKELKAEIEELKKHSCDCKK